MRFQDHFSSKLKQHDVQIRDLVLSTFLVGYFDQHAGAPMRDFSSSPKLRLQKKDETRADYVFREFLISLAADRGCQSSCTKLVSQATSKAGVVFPVRDLQCMLLAFQG